MFYREPKIKGFTLLELLVVIAILGILMTIAVPSFNGMLERNKMRALASDWRGAFYLAQREALRLKHRITMCPSNDGIKCQPNDSDDYSVGWIVIDTSDSNNVKVIQDYPPPNSAQNISIALNRNNQLIFQNNGRLPSTFPNDVTLAITSSRLSNLSPLKFKISRSGNIQVDTTPP